MEPPKIFDRPTRRLRRDRAVAGYSAHAFLRRAMLDGIEDRLAAVTRSFTDVLDLGCFDGSFASPSSARVARVDAGYGFASASKGIQADEDRLPFRDASFDLVISAGVLDQVDDLPGTLSLIRRVLRPDGLFLGAFAGAGSLASLKSLLREAEPDHHVQRIHPQIDVRSAGDLLVRAGFALPVADTETLDVNYRDLDRLLGDLRGMAASNVLAQRTPMTRPMLRQMFDRFDRRKDDRGRMGEVFTLIFLTGWAPDPSQPVAARRGSATVSLADALRR